MITSYLRSFLLLAIAFHVVLSSFAQQKNTQAALLNRYDLGMPDSKEPQSFLMQSKLILLAPDGTRKDSTIYTLHLRCIPGKNREEGDEYTCTRFTVRSNNEQEISIPSVSNWKYIYRTTASNRDDKGQVLGIDHAKFENLKDSSGRSLSIEKNYHVYNAFIDFHTMFVFSERTASGKGVQDLHQVGDKIVHSAAFSEPPVNLGKQIKEGSVFKNGEITLEFKGLGRINNKPCAILGYDSGSSSFKMLMEPMPSLEVNTTGSSHYWGDIYKDLQSGWIQFASLHELVVSQTVISGQANKVHSVIERMIEVKNISK